jgi:hypothetical protein
MSHLHVALVSTVKTSVGVRPLSMARRCLCRRGPSLFPPAGFLFTTMRSSRAIWRDGPAGHCHVANGLAVSDRQP